MSESDLIETIASVIRRTNRGASEVTVARAIVTDLSVAGYEIVRTRPAGADVYVEPPPVIERRPRRAG